MFDKDTEFLYHPPGMLHREQRTAMTATTRENLHSSSCINCLRCLSEQLSSSTTILQELQETTNNTKFSRRSKKSKTHGSIRRLADVLFFCVCLLGILTVPTSKAAPIGDITMMESKPPKWVNPCGMGVSQDIPTQDSEVNTPQVTDAELLTQIVIQAESALEQAKSFGADYVRETFADDFNKHHEIWSPQRYNWLPSREQIPKGLGEPVPSEHLTQLELDSALVNSYEHLQRFAVGLEQVVKDQDKEQSKIFKSSFERAEFRLRALLCEIQLALIERGVKQRDDVDRGIMVKEYREIMESGFRNLRDWLIYRDYMNTLEYVIQIFKHLKNSL